MVCESALPRWCLKAVEAMGSSGRIMSERRTRSAPGNYLDWLGESWGFAKGMQGFGA